MIWKYVGRGDWLPGVPRRDLSDEEAKRYGVQRSPLYERERPRRIEAETPPEGEE